MPDQSQYLDLPGRQTERAGRRRPWNRGSLLRRYVGWQTFFDFGDGQVKNNKKIDTTIASVLFNLPLPAIAPHTQTSPTVLPQRNLLTHADQPA